MFLLDSGFYSHFHSRSLHSLTLYTPLINTNTNMSGYQSTHVVGAYTVVRHVTKITVFRDGVKLWSVNDFKGLCIMSFGIAVTQVNNTVYIWAIRATHRDCDKYSLVRIDAETGCVCDANYLFDGQILNITSDNRYLYATFDNNTYLSVDLTTVTTVASGPLSDIGWNIYPHASIKVNGEHYVLYNNAYNRPFMTGHINDLLHYPTKRPLVYSGRC